jgi:hypothetical protein
MNAANKFKVHLRPDGEIGIDGLTISILTPEDALNLAGWLVKIATNQKIGPEEFTAFLDKIKNV